jgi:hypothetical protein
MTNRAPLTPEAKAAFNEALGTAFRKMESQICDLKCAAIVLETMMEDTINSPAEECAGLLRFDLTADQHEGLIYAFFQICNQARAIKDAYDEAWAASPQAKSQQAEAA